MLKTKIIGIGLFIGVVVAVALIVSPVHWGFLNPGPMIPGHESLACTSCHEPAPGTTRQQLQAKAAHLMGWRKTSVVFGFDPPTNSDCQACHARPDDRHPVHRFSEPRFTGMLKTVDARSCVACHREHQGSRVSSGARFCAACHNELVVKDDPLDVSHRSLVGGNRWETCLGCHDFHGNHVRLAQRQLSGAHSVQAIEAYLDRGPDPYAPTKTHPARDTRQ